MLHYNSNIDLGQIATAISLLIAVLTFIIKERSDIKRELRIANRETYQKLELASIDLFRFDAINIELSSILWGDYEIPLDSGKRYAYLNYVCQILNLFEMSIRFKKEKVMPAEVFGSWVIWYYDLCERKNFKPIWSDVKMNYTCDLRKIIEKGICDAKEGRKKDFFAYVAREVNYNQIAKWLYCGEVNMKKNCKNCTLSEGNKYKKTFNDPSLNFDSVTFSWCNSIKEIKEIAAFFTKHKNVEYISHGEVQDGRASNFSTWHSDFRKLIFTDFKKALKKNSDFEESYLLAQARFKDELIGFCFIMIKKKLECSYIELQDFIIDPNFQRKGIGSALIKWIEKSMRLEGIKKIFLESGIDNHDAHSFFTQRGFHVCSKMFYKEI
ncbi:MAG: GNAT family N-acetyltransferase [Bacteroidales bacterium]|nr:GNAT family N-acetyltransferase [Bacteroidales bacterium]